MIWITVLREVWRESSWLERILVLLVVAVLILQVTLYVRARINCTDGVVIKDAASLPTCLRVK